MPAQRWVLLLDTLRQRGNRSLEESSKAAPHVLEFEFEHILDGKTLPRPTNYQLVRIIPPPGTQIRSHPAALRRGGSRGPAMVRASEG